MPDPARAPALVAGAFVVWARLAAADSGDPAALARQLLADGCRAECRVECGRILAAQPDHAGAAGLLRECGEPRAPAAPAASMASLPGRAIVRFYRAFVGPALGSRCSLDPSCSEYFLRVSRRHGLLGFPMMADRLVREPSVVHAHPVPAPPGGKVRVPDPVCDHDFWMAPRRAACGSNRKAQP